jgi:glycosyltransferase involved in cell wall biosynthesis
MTPQILFDGRVYQFQKTGGISRYFSEIIKGLPRDWIPIVTGIKAFRANAPSHPNLRLKTVPDFRPRRYLRPLAQKLWKPGIIRNTNLLHPTYYDMTSGLALSDFKCPVVQTVYDLIYARFPRQMDDAQAFIQSQQKAVQRADRVICLSKSTERDLLEFIPEAAGKTTVIHLASSLAVAEPITDGRQFDNPTFLFVGARAGYKNFILLLRAFAKAATVAPNLRLQLAGPPLTAEERWQIYDLGISDRVVDVVFPDEATLQGLYHTSVALLYPSRYEGFGIPPLEAMACGTLAVTANTSSLPEVVGEAGIMLDPADEGAWTDCIIKLSQPFHGRDELLAKGRLRAAQFSWAECARRHREIYQALL